MKDLTNPLHPAALRAREILEASSLYNPGTYVARVIRMPVPEHGMYVRFQKAEVTGSPGEGKTVWAFVNMEPIGPKGIPKKDQHRLL